MNASANRPTLLFLPGTLCDARVWQGIPSRLLADGWRCVHVDYRNQHSISSMAETALNSAAGRVIPIGLSMGGMVALDISQRAPARVAALVLLDTNADADTPDRQARRNQQILYAKQHGMAALAATVLAPSYAVQTNAQAKIVTDMAAAQNTDNFAAQSNALADRRDMWQHLTRINVPTLIACGEHDALCTPAVHQRMAMLTVNSDYQVIPNAGHLAPLDAPDVVGDMLLSWLANITNL